MTIAYTIDAALPLVRSVLSGTVTRDDVTAYYARLLADPHFDPAFWHLADIRGVEEFRIVPSDVPGVMKRPVFNRGVRRAIVAATAEQWNMAFEFAIVAKRDEHVVRVFADTAGAEAWLWSPAHPD